jgi:DNA-binding CsgD family transcriptional regulator/tetratricopeptide (TPR) repeat protein
VELLERAANLAELDRHLQEAAAGRGRLLFLDGEAGVGKTVLVEDYAAAVRGRARVLRGACDPLATRRALGPLVDVAADLGGELNRLLAAGARHDVFRALLATLAGSGRPSLVVFEDVHWADDATIDLLRFLGRRIGDSSALLVATFGDDEVGSRHPLRVVLDDLATSVAVSRMTLAPLSPAAVARLAHGADIDPRELHRRTGGNPFFVTEVLAVGATNIPPTVREAVLTRVARLSRAGRTALEAAAVIGVRAEAWLLTAIAGDEAGIAECLEHGVLLTRDESYSFRHEIARAAVLSALDGQQAPALHATVLASLRAHGMAPEELPRLAHHAEAAGDAAAVLDYAVAAAQRAAALDSHREAAAQYARALRFATPGQLPQAVHAELLEAFSHESSLSDDLDAALAAQRDAVAIRRRLDDRLAEARSLLALAERQHDLMLTAAATETVNAALALLERRPPGSELARAWNLLAQLHQDDSDPAAAIDWGERAVALGEQLRDPPLLLETLTTLGTVRTATDPDRARDELERALELAHELGQPAPIVRLLNTLAANGMAQLDLARAARYVDEGIALATHHDLDRWRHSLLATRAMQSFCAGRWGDAVDAAGEVARHPSASASSRGAALLILGRVRVRRGDPDGTAVLDEALALAEQSGDVRETGPVRAGRAEAAWLAGNNHHARAEAATIWDLEIHRRHAWWMAEIGFWFWRTGEPVSLPERWHDPRALQVAGDWRAAADAWSRLGWPYEEAQALADGDEPALRRALALCEQLGAQPLATLVTRRLRELGAQHVPRGPRPSTRANPAGLTRRQLEVLHLLAEGLPNATIAEQLFIAPKTIEHHVSAILAALGVSSRTEAVREAVRRGIIPQRQEDRALD